MVKSQQFVHDIVAMVVCAPLRCLCHGALGVGFVFPCLSTQAVLHLWHTFYCLRLLVWLFKEWNHSLKSHMARMLARGLQCFVQRLF